MTSSRMCRTWIACPSKSTTTVGGNDNAHLPVSTLPQTHHDWRNLPELLKKLRRACITRMDDQL